jgi:hypothetical protein
VEWTCHASVWKTISETICHSYNNHGRQSQKMARPGESCIECSQTSSLHLFLLLRSTSSVNTRSNTHHTANNDGYLTATNALIHHISSRPFPPRKAHNILHSDMYSCLLAVSIPSRHEHPYPASGYSQRYRNARRLRGMRKPSPRQKVAETCPVTVASSNDSARAGEDADTNA